MNTNEQTSITHFTNKNCTQYAITLFGFVIYLAVIIKNYPRFLTVSKTKVAFSKHSLVSEDLCTKGSTLEICP